MTNRHEPIKVDDIVVMMGMEIEARVMIEKHRQDAPWSPDRQILLSVFKAQPTSALTRDQIQRIGAALHGLSEWDPAAILRDCVKRGLLRTRSSRGMRLYELAFT